MLFNFVIIKINFLYSFFLDEHPHSSNLNQEVNTSQNETEHEQQRSSDNTINQETENERRDEQNVEPLIPTDPNDIIFENDNVRLYIQRG